MNGNEAVIKNHLRHHKVDVAEIMRTSHFESKFSSFKISIAKSDLDAVLQPSFWPRGVVCEPWRHWRFRRGGEDGDGEDGGGEDGGSKRGSADSIDGDDGSRDDSDTRRRSGTPNSSITNELTRQVNESNSIIS